MDTKFQTSFIPKKPVTASVREPHSGFSFLSLIAGVMFIASIGLAVLAFVYPKYLTQQISDMQSNLEKTVATFDSSLIDTYTKLDKKLMATESLLKQHTAVSALFDFLSSHTIKTVSFNNFNYALSDGKIIISMSGEADSFSTIALQSDQLAQNGNIKDAIFDGLNVNDKGKVTFNFKSTIDPNAIHYVDGFKGVSIR